MQSPRKRSRNVGVIVPAAGQGLRTGFEQPKQYREVAGVPLLLRTIRPFSSHPSVRQIVVALPPDDVTGPPAWLGELVGDALLLVPGGATRAHSVRNALSALDPDCEAVLVHDAARPFVSRDVIDRLIERVQAGGSCIAAVPMSDTVKRGGPDNMIGATVDRTGLWRAQTPQGFPRAILAAAFERRGDDLSCVTDESSLVEAAGYPVELVSDEPGNFKLTLPGDFEMAERLLQ